LISRGFIKKSLIYTVAGALPMASALLLLPFYIAYLPTDVYGALSICLTIAIFIQVVVTYSFDTSLFIHYHEFKHDRQKLSVYISSVFLFIAIFGFCVAVMLSLVGGLAYDLIFPGSTISFYPYGFMAVAIGVFQAIFKVYCNLLQTREKPTTFLLANVFVFTIIAVGTIVGLEYSPATLTGPLGSRVLAGGCAAVWAMTMIVIEFGVHFKSPWQLTSSSFNAYTFIYQLQQWAINYLDNFLIMLFLPLSSVGIYDFAKKCLVPVELMMNGLNASINPRVVSIMSGQEQKQSSPEVNRYYYGFVAVIALLVCLSILVIPFGLQFFLQNSDYTNAIQYIPYVALVYLFKVTRLYFVVPFAVLKQMKTLTILSFIITIVKVGLMVVLMMEWHLYGLIFSSFVAYALEIVILRLNLQKWYFLKFNYVKLFLVPFVIFAMILLLESFVSHSNAWMLHSAYALGCMVLLFIAYRNELKFITVTKSLK